MIAKVLVALVVLVLAGLTYPGALVESLTVIATPTRESPPGPPGALSWLHVAHPSGARAYIADDQGRMVILRGTTPAGLLEFGPGTSPPYPVDPSVYMDGKCPPMVGKYPPVCRADVEEMARLGFNVIRLPISWSVLEPSRGALSKTLVDRLAQIVDWARESRMYVVIDMHQNAYSHYIDNGNGVNLAFNSGAPSWATITDGLPSFALKGQRELNPAVFEATTNFWYNRDGIQEAYIAAVAFMARRFVNDPVVAGYGLYNEPWYGWNLSPGFEDLLLFPFYRRVIDAITGTGDGLPCPGGIFMPAVCGYRDLGVDDRRHLMFMDTGLGREITDFPTHLGLPVTSYPNTVLAIHAYTHFYTPDKLVFNQNPRHASYPWGGYEQGYASAEREARAMGSALFVEEFGNNPDDDDALLANQLFEQETHRLGSAFWTWKENGGSSWGIFNPAGTCMRPARVQALARVYPRLTSDPGATYHYDSSSGAFSFGATGRTGDPTTVVYVPPEVSGEITSSGDVSVVVSDEEDGSRLVIASPSRGAFNIAVSPAPLRLTPCP